MNSHHQTLATDWEVRIDNDFAAKVLSAIKQSPSLALPAIPVSLESGLCGPCQQFRDSIWNPSFSKIYGVSSLEAKSKTCTLCGLFWRTCQRQKATKLINVMFERVGSSLRMNGVSGHGLSIFRSLDLKTRIDRDIQIGFGKLPDGNDETQFEIINQWLTNCDKNHSHATCRPSPHILSFSSRARSDSTTKQMPTRVIDVGQKGSDTVRLVETNPRDTGEWVALSHQWGPDPKTHFRTTVQTLEQHKRGIPFGSLPSTFRDAITVTRALPACRYLWIDSICVVQGEGGDFNNEAKRMEQVYSGAYCVLASSRAKHQQDGFLKPLDGRDCVALVGRGTDAPFYICETIDDFDAHVLKGALNRRGWVLQEHALARRTIFFTDKQMYFECGEGVRCETMMRMRNDLAAFLGDPNFPQIIEQANQGEKIMRYQNLYKQYSELDLTNAYDRPVAIDGLQDRILSALRTNGGFGVFDEGKKKGLLRRSLLWYRGNDTPRLKRIVFPPNRPISIVPSWSWMAYTGGIEYISPVFGGSDWEEMESPWSSAAMPGRGGNPGGRGVRSNPSNIALVTMARRFDGEKAKDGEKLIKFDDPGEYTSSGPPDPEVLCVVVGRQKANKETSLSAQRTMASLSPSREVRRDNLLNYFILVRPMRNQAGAVGSTIGGHAWTKSVGDRLYERVGAGYLPERCIREEDAMIVTIY